MNEELTQVRVLLQEILYEYRGLRPNLSLRCISRKAGVNRYFLSKIMEGERSKVDLEQLLLLYKFFRNSDVLNSLIQKNLVKIESLIKDSFLSADEEYLFIENKCREIDFHDRYYFLIMIFACCDYGFTETEIAGTLGEVAKQKIADLIENKIIVKTPEGKIKIPGSKTLYFTRELIQYHAFDLVRFYKVANKGQKRNGIGLRVQGLNKEGLAKATDLFCEYESRLLEIIKDKENWGGNPFFHLNIMDTLTDRLK